MLKKSSFLLIVLISALTLSGCSANNELGTNDSSANTKVVQNNYKNTKSNLAVAKTNNQNDGFLGIKGKTIESDNGKIKIPLNEVNSGQAQFYNYKNSNGKNIYFFVVKSEDGKIRAAANSCEVCHASKRGFEQVGNMMMCRNCRTKYPFTKISEEKGGCNPGPISKNIRVEDDFAVINVSDVEAVAYLF